VTEEYLELYYFLDDEFGKVENLRYVLRGIGERKRPDSALRYVMDCYGQNSNLEYSELVQEDGYELGDGSDSALFETDNGLFVVSNSRYIDQNSFSIPSRSEKSIVKQV